jgi:hypothetical protein
LRGDGPVVWVNFAQLFVDRLGQAAHLCFGGGGMHFVRGASDAKREGRSLHGTLSSTRGGDRGA